MNLTVQLTPEDYVRANSLVMRPRPVFKWAGAFLLLLAAIALAGSIWFSIVQHQGFAVPLMLMVCLAYLAFLFKVLIPRRVRKIFAQQKALQIPYACTPGGEGMFVKSEISEENLPWNHFIKWKEGKELFVLCHSDVMFRVLPKRCFQSPEEIAEFRRLLESKLGPASA